MISGELLLSAIIIMSTVALSYPIGIYMAKVFAGEKVIVSKVLLPIENYIHRLLGVKCDDEADWKKYLKSFAIFFAFGFLLLFALQMTQHWFPLNPGRFPAVRWDSAVNITASFCTNTNWQPIGFENSISPFVQMLGITVQNFVSAAAGLAVGIALIRGFVRKGTDKIGNFWVDLTRGILYILLPLSLVMAVFIGLQGVPQNLGKMDTVMTMEGQSQTIVTGPVASQVAIKQLGSNGGGYYNGNSSHPFENPTPISNAVETGAIILLPIALIFTFGKMSGSMKKAWALFAVCMLLFMAGLGITMVAESQANPNILKSGGISGPSLEGKEVRFGIPQTALWAQATTATSNGSINGVHDSLMPLSGLALIFNMITGEVIFGGVGVGLVGLLLYAVLTMFIGGLMIGKTPELLGKKLGIPEMVWACIGVLSPCIVLLVLLAVGLATKQTLPVSAQGSIHDFSRALYANASYVGNNGSAFAGLNANTVFMNLTGSFGMLFGRFVTIISGLAIAGSLAKKNQSPANTTQIPITSVAFIVMLLAVILIVGALTFFPALSLGPVLEHLKLSGM